MINNVLNEADSETASPGGQEGRSSARGAGAKASRAPLWVAWAVALLILYVLGIGPLFIYNGKASKLVIPVGGGDVVVIVTVWVSATQDAIKQPTSIAEYAYAPLVWLCLRSEYTRRALAEYINWCAGTRVFVIKKSPGQYETYPFSDNSLRLFPRIE